MYHKLQDLNTAMNIQFRITTYSACCYEMNCIMIFESDILMHICTWYTAQLQ